MSIARNEVEAWGQWLRAVGRPETTIGLRTYHVVRAFREIQASPYTLTADDLVGWLAGKSWKAETRRSYISSLRAFYRWCQATGRRPDNPAALLPPIKPPRGVPRPTPDAIYRAGAARRRRSGPADDPARGAVRSPAR
jgi:hypothetical protein